MRKLNFFRLPSAVAQLQSQLTNLERLLLKSNEPKPAALVMNDRRVIRTVRSLALALGYSKSHIHRMVQSGKIPSYQNRVNGKLIFDPSEVLKAFSRGNAKKHTL